MHRPFTHHALDEQVHYLSAVSVTGIWTIVPAGVNSLNARSARTSIPFDLLIGFSPTAASRRIPRA